MSANTAPDEISAAASHPCAWVDDHVDYLYRFAMHRVGNAGTAEELVQETFLAALQARGSFEGRSSIRTWLTSILKHKIADHFRAHPVRETPELRKLEAWCEDLFGRRGTWRRKRGAWPPMPTDEPEQQELAAKLEECLGRLPSNVAEIFVLYEQREIAGDRIAEAIGISTGTLWVRLYRARLALRECLYRNWLGRDR